MSRLHPLHQERGDETSHGEQCLRDSEQVRAIGSCETGLDFCHVVNEEAGDGNLRSYVAELRRNTPEECVLVAERLVLVTSGGSGLVRLGGDVGICDFRDAIDVVSRVELM